MTCYDMLLYVTCSKSSAPLLLFTLSALLAAHHWHLIPCIICPPIAFAPCTTALPFGVITFSALPQQIIPPIAHHCLHSSHCTIICPFILGIYSFPSMLADNPAHYLPHFIPLPVPSNIQATSICHKINYICYFIIIIIFPVNAGDLYNFQVNNR